MAGERTDQSAGGTTTKSEGYCSDGYVQYGEPVATQIRYASHQDEDLSIYKVHFS